MSTIYKPLESSPVSLLNAKPDVGIYHNRLDWQKLKLLSKEERSSRIVKRANIFAYDGGPKGISRFNFLNAVAAAKGLGDQKYQERPVPDIEFPIEEALKLFPQTHLDEYLVTNATQNRLQNFPDLATVQAAFKENEELFKKGILYGRLEILFRDLFKAKKIDKIVALGGGCLVDSYPTWVLRLMRTIWKEVHPDAGADIPIYIQDLEYQELDLEVASSLNMQVVNGDLGHQVGWTLLDESTFLVDLRCTIPIVQMAFEFTRPAAFYSPFYLDAELYSDARYKRYSLVVKNNAGEKVVIPQPGVNELETIETLLKEYKEERVNLDDLDLSSVKGVDGIVYGADGYREKNGDTISHIGLFPTLYTRRDVVETPVVPGSSK